MIVELFVPCFFGSLVTANSKLITHRIYDSNWIDKSQKYKKAIKIFVERTFTPIAFYAGGQFLLDLQSFLQVFIKFSQKCVTKKCISRSLL